MALERTFSIIKPDATRRNLTGAINDRIEKAGLRIVGTARHKCSVLRWRVPLHERTHPVRQHVRRGELLRRVRL